MRRPVLGRMVREGLPEVKSSSMKLKEVTIYEGTEVGKLEQPEWQASLSYH